MTADTETSPVPPDRSESRAREDVQQRLLAEVTRLDAVNATLRIDPPAGGRNTETLSERLTSAFENAAIGMGSSTWRAAGSRSTTPSARSPAWSSTGCW